MSGPTPEQLRLAAMDFVADEDCHPDPAVGGWFEQRCALIEPCTLRCYIRHREGESQLNDHLFAPDAASAGEAAAVAREQEGKETE